MEGFLGEIRLFAGTFAPRNWMFCEGQTMQTNAHIHLASVLGHINDATFQLPDLRDRIAAQPGDGILLGALGGNNTVTLTEGQLPAHSHSVKLGVNIGAGNSDNPSRGIISTGAGPFSATATPNSALGGVTQESVGSSAPIDIRNPYLGLRFIICIEGVFPSRV